MNSDLSLMVDKEFENFLIQHNNRRKILIVLAFTSMALVFFLLFINYTIITAQKSWLLVSALLMIVFSLLGIVRLRNRHLFFNEVLQFKKKCRGHFVMVTDKGDELSAALKIGDQEWEIHLYPPLFSKKNLNDCESQVEILMDKNSRPAIVKTTKGWLYVSSARLGR